MTVSGGLFRNNVSGSDGGGLYANSTLSLTGAQFLGNRASAGGGALHRGGGGAYANLAATLSGGLFQDANGLYRQTRSEPQTVAAMMRAHGDALPPNDRARLQAIVETVASMAAGLAELDADSASIAYARMCMSRAREPANPPTGAALGKQYESAIACGRKGAAGSLERKECVAAAFGARREIGRRVAIP